MMNNGLMMNSSVIAIKILDLISMKNKYLLKMGYRRAIMGTASKHKER
jgi:hypothetical protein